MTDDLVRRLEAWADNDAKYGHHGRAADWLAAKARIEALEGEADTAAELLALVLWADPGVKEAAARKVARDWWVKRDEAIRAALTPEAPHAD